MKRLLLLGLALGVLALVGVTGLPEIGAAAWLPDLGRDSVSLSMGPQVRDRAYLKAAFPAAEHPHKFLRYGENRLEVVGELNQIHIFQALAASDTHTVHILHLGDSHIQADYLTQKIRQNLQSLFGDAGRGWVFPYALAKTNQPNAYHSRKEAGQWRFNRLVARSPELPMGLTGVTVSTQDTLAAFQFRFSPERCPTPGANVRIYGRFDSTWNKLKVRSQEEESPWPSLELQPQAFASLGYIPLELPDEKAQSWAFSFHQQGNQPLELYGLRFARKGRGGLLYSSLGVNGARVANYCRADLLSSQLQSDPPDMVVLDLGVNDYYTARQLPGYLVDSLYALAARVRLAAPEATLLLTTQQPVMRRRKPVRCAAEYSDVVRQVAQRLGSNVLVWDFYRVADVPKSVQKWKAAGLMTRDGIHLQVAGYQHKGQLFTEALVSGYLRYLGEEGEPLASLAPLPSEEKVEAKAEEKVAEPVAVAPKPIAKPTVRKPKPVKDPSPTSGKVYRVKEGDNLFKIARNLKISRARLKQLNPGLGDHIRPGQKIILP